MKKTFLLITFVIGFCGFLSAAEPLISDVALYNEINLSFENKYYPGTVDKVNQLEKYFSDSVFLIPALACKGDALINLYRYDEAVETLQKAISYMHTGSEEIAHCTYLLGKAYYCKKDYKTALDYFHKACGYALTDGVMDYYNLSVLYGAKSYYLLEDFNNAIQLMEYVVQNGKAYSKPDYEDVLQMIMLSYNQTGSYKKTLNLYNQLDESQFSQDFYYTLCIYNADALNGVDRNKDAYEVYCKVIEGKNEKLAVIALKKAYVLATEKNIGVNPGEVFSKTVDTFGEHPELVNEFWIRLGIDEYNAKNYGKAEDYFANVPEGNAVVLLYKAKMLLDRDKNPSEAEKLLGGIENEIKKSKVENISDSYYSVLLQCKFQQKKWTEIPAVYNKIKNPDSGAVYALSACYYNSGDYSKVSSDTGVLYASSLCKQGNYPAAVKVFSNLKLNDDDRGEYAKALFACGNFSEAYNQILLSSDNHKEYIAGLCTINLKDWAQAKVHFANYIKQLSGKTGFVNLVFFYKGYAEYCLEEYKNAYASFVRFGSEAGTGQNSYIRKAYEYAAKSALQNGDFKSASVQAENIIKNSITLEEKHEAVLFCADVFSDYENYDKALSILNPYINEKNDFAVQALFTSAKIYEKKGDVASADNYFQRIYTDYSKSELAEEALYRTGEVYYLHQEYITALNRFNNYIYKYTNGKFSDAAMFFGGECALRSGELDRAIMLNKTMLQKYPESIYAYGANNNLLTAYYDQESYGQALEVARVMVRSFPEQAASDEIGRRLIELEKIVTGTDRQVAVKQSEYEKAGKLTTRKGRVIGTELVKLYADNSYTQKEAFELALQLLEKQTSPDEYEYGAYNAEIAADYYRKNQENTNAAKMYLKAAEYYRSTEDSTKAASALYSAVEAFKADDFDGDARETAGLLKQLYPDSKQADRVDRLLKN